MTQGSGSPRSLLYALCHRELAKVSDLTSRLNTINSPRHDKLAINLAYLVRRYLEGTGHPESTRGGLIAADVYDKDLNDPFLRSRLFMVAVMDSSIPPFEDWSVKVSLVLFSVPFHCVLTLRSSCI